MRTVLVVLAFFVAFFGLLLGGATLAFVGAVEMATDAERYDVRFGRPGDECDGGGLKVDVADGAPLARTVGMPMEQPEFTRLPGFTDAQQDEVETLVRRLGGGGGLSDSEQRRIQNRVDELAATVPPVRDPTSRSVRHPPGPAWWRAAPHPRRRPALPAPVEPVVVSSPFLRCAVHTGVPGWSAY